MSLHPGLFFCFRFSYGISRLRHCKKKSGNRIAFLKNRFFSFPEGVFSPFLCKVGERLSKPRAFCSVFVIKRVGFQDMIAGQGFDSLHPAKRRMFLGKTQLFSAFLLPLNAFEQGVRAKTWRKMATSTHHRHLSSQIFLCFFCPLIGLLREQRISVNPRIAHQNPAVRR